MKQTLNAQAAKKEFVKSIHNWLTRTLDERGHGQFKENFLLQDSSIMCEIPSCFFDNFEIPEGLKIEMKFTVKKQ